MFAASLAWADQSDPRLEGLFEALRSSPTQGAAAETERAIWQIWLTRGDRDIDALMSRATEHMAARRIGEAVALFSEVIDRAPDFAEAWNKLATAHYLAQDYAASVADIHRTLELEPRHFGAIAGLGLILMRRNDHTGALQAFERVLSIHPNARGARMHVEILTKMLREKSV